MMGVTGCGPGEIIETLEKSPCVCYAIKARLPPTTRTNIKRVSRARLRMTQPHIHSIFSRL